ncbi:hypothetical protein, partial [Escherichia albertii]|uniref:hypothetical protein n=1 Tax=Escherichia albertii TaxID=208962 RepID=UPI001F34B7A9
RSATAVGLIRRDSVASGVDCRMRRERLIRPTFGNGCRPDKTRQRRHQALIAGCGVNALSGLRSATAVGCLELRLFGGAGQRSN